MIYRLRQDNDLFRLEVYGDHTAGGDPWWKALSLVALYKAFGHEPDGTDAKLFYLSALMLYSGEGHNRAALQRMIVRGTRNLRLAILPAVHYLRESLQFAREAGTRSSAAKRPSSEKNVIPDDIKDLIRESLAPLKVRLFGPRETYPAGECYRITDQVLQASGDSCKDYLNQMKTRGPLTVHRYEKLKDELSTILRQEHPGEEEFQEIYDAVMCAFDRSRSSDHLSAISLTSKNGHLLVCIVNVRREMITMEAWKLLRLVEDHGKSLNLGGLERKGYWEPETLLEFNANKAGDVYAVYIPDDSAIHVACERTKITSQNKSTTESMDKAAFIVDQDYLVSLYITITQLRADQKRFDSLREKAEARVVTNVDHLFDPCLFE